MLSIIVPIYNSAKYLEQCIESILDQTLKDIELILVDDGSTDNSASICEKYVKKDSRVSSYHIKHGGPFLARRYGILIAKGDYITFVDSDDFIEKESYNRAIDDMTKNVDVIAFDIYRYFSEQSIRYDMSWPIAKFYEREEIEDEIFPKMIWDKRNRKFGLDPSLCNKIFKTKLLKEHMGGMSELTFHYGEDVAVIYPFLKKVQSISVHRYAYYYHRQIVSSAKMPKYVEDCQYLDKLYTLYRLLVNSMGTTKNFREQIDLFYCHSVDFIKKKYYDDQPIIWDKLFPFEKIEKGEKVVVYGAGNVGRQYISQIDKTGYCKIVLWVDQNPKEDEVLLPDKISTVEYDKIVIAIKDRKKQTEIYEYLCTLGIEKEKIIGDFI